MAEIQGSRHVKLSDLNVDILGCIVSYLNARHAVQTCVLAKRWRYLWRTLPRIHAEFCEFDKFNEWTGTKEVGDKTATEVRDDMTDTEERDYTTDIEEGDDATDTEEGDDTTDTEEGDDSTGTEEGDDVTGTEMDEVVFKRFVNTLLECRDPDAAIDKFWVRYPMSDGNNFGGRASAHAKHWIRHAIEKKAKAVEVVVLTYALELDFVVFESQFLRRVGLSNVLLNKGFFKQLRQGCPVLEDLFLYDCTILDDEISSHSVKILTIDGTQFSDEYQAHISSPSVSSLTLSYPMARVPLLEHMPSIVTASVSLNSIGVEFNYPTGMSHLLMSLSGVRKLDLNYSGDEVTIENNLQWCPTFVNLAYLILGQWCLDSNFYTLTVFLENSPKLEKLTLKLTKSKTERIIGELQQRSFTCEHLKIVDVICFEDDPQLDRVKELFVASGTTNPQINVIPRDKIQHEDPMESFFRYDYR